MRRPLLLLALMPLSALAAQSVVVPAAYASQDAGSIEAIAGFAGRFRQQVLVQGAQLAMAQGSQLHSLWFRRDSAFGQAMPALSSQLKITLSHAARTTGAPSTSFAANRGPDEQVVFDGVLQLPGSLPAQPPYAWQAPYAVQVGFTQPFAYQGGDLCIELEGELLAPAGAGWWVDCVQEVIGSAVREVGTSCGATASRGPTTASSRARNLMPGGTFFVSTFGQAGSAGILAMGTATTNVPLAAWGAPGCALYVQPQTTLSYVFGVYGSEPDSEQSLTFALPAHTALLNARFYVQGVNLERPAVSNAAGLTTTNALEFTVGSVPPPATMSLVVSDGVATGQPWPASGAVFVSRGPVMKFDYF